MRTPPPSHLWSRRDVLGAGVGLTATALLGAGCAGRDGSARTSSEIGSNLAFAAPWEDLVDERMRAMGLRAIISAPGAIDHARAKLSGATSATARATLRDSCIDDGRAGAMSEADGWLIPTTLAGLLGALGALTA